MHIDTGKKIRFFPPSHLLSFEEMSTCNQPKIVARKDFFFTEKNMACSCFSRVEMYIIDFLLLYYLLKGGERTIIKLVINYKIQGAREKT